MRLLVLALTFLLCAFPAEKKNVTVHGFITSVHSQNSFEIDDFRIDRDSSLTLEFEKDDAEQADTEPVRDIRVGTEVEVKGEYDSDAHQLHAKTIKVLPSELKKVKRTALVESVPEIRNLGNYWEGTFRVDGQRLVVDEHTKLTIVPNKTQKKAQKQAAQSAKQTAANGDPSAAEGLALTRLDDVHKNMFVSYQGVREADGTIRALKLEFKDNEFTSGEARLWKRLTPKVKAFRPEEPGEIRIARVGKFKTVPDDAVQQYVRRLGESLIPANQRELPNGDPNKIPFRFFVVQKKVPNAFACANGTVVVNSGLFNAVENESQLAFVMGHEIAHATQEHTARQMEYHKKKRAALAIGATFAGAYGGFAARQLVNMVNAAIVNGYTRHLENQADRLGMEYMLAAGYDPREAPRAWKALALKHGGDVPMNFFWSSHDNNTMRRSYLMAELRNSYQGVSFDSKKRDGDEFRHVAELLQSRENAKKKAKAKK